MLSWYDTGTSPHLNLLMLPNALRHPPQHVHVDMEEFLCTDQTSTAYVLSHLCELTWTQTVKWIKQASAIRLSAPCKVCGSSCELKQAFCHIAGPPCTDWSPQGSRSGTWGASWLCTCVW